MYQLSLPLSGFIFCWVLVSFITKLKWSAAHLGKHHSKFITSNPPPSLPAVDVLTTHELLNRVLERGDTCVGGRVG